METLNRISLRLWRIRDLRQGLDEILTATIELLSADMGNIQLLDLQRKVLVIAAQRGFGQEFLDFFREVSGEDESACGKALRSGERIIIEDVETDAAYVPLRSVARAAEFRAVQSTPLIDRDGTQLGMLSTHFRSLHRPSQEELQRLDLYVRQAADFIERHRTGEVLHKSEAAVRALLETAAQAILTVDADGRIELVKCNSRTDVWIFPRRDVRSPDRNADPYAVAWCPSASPRGLFRSPTDPTHGNLARPCGPSQRWLRVSH